MTDLVVRGVRRSFGPVVALDGVDLDVASGELLSVVGPSGCGKTTLLRIVAGFDRPDAGTVRIGDRTVAGAGTFVPDHRRRVGVVPQDGALFEHLDVAGNVAFGLGRRASREGAARVAELLELVGLAGLGARRPSELSGGQQQRVAVARALAPRPPLVLLDEPFSALDAGLRAGVRADIRAALEADGATSLLVTHDQDEALSVSDRVAVIDAGRILQAGTPDEVYRRPASPRVADLLGDAVTLAVTGLASEHGRLVAQTPCGPVVVAPSPGGPPTGTVVAVLRPEQVALEDDPGAVPAVVEQVSFHGHDAVLTARLADGTSVRSRVSGEDPAARRHPGDRVGVRVLAEAWLCPAHTTTGGAA